MFKSIKRFMFFVLLALVLAAAFVMYPRFEWHSPQVDFLITTESIGFKPFEVIVTDRGEGLSKVEVLLVDERGKMVIETREYPRGIKSDNITIGMGTESINATDGPAQIKVVAEDHSLFRLFRGNRTIATKDINIDLTPPAITWMASTRYINLGGSAVAVYRTSEDVVKTGVMVGDHFFRGYSGHFPDQDIYISFFAYPHDMEKNENIYIVAEDGAENLSQRNLSYSLRNVNYRNRSLTVSENFIERVILPLLGHRDARNLTPLETFLKVNRDMRRDNDQLIEDITSDSTDRILWEGRFLQLSNSKVEARFADRRQYILNGEVVDEQYHLGIDLSVTERYPVESSNHGIVVYAGDLGIYGNTVIIDHGMGIMTLYSHLSTMSVDAGQTVSKGEIIGRTGVTGLAGGDHLHFGIYINGIPVRPIEWWDENWIMNNILSNLEQFKYDSGTISYSEIN